MVLIVILYEKDATSFTDNGICILSPTSCVVREVAGGEYELELEHPLDDHHKYLMITEERLIKAPVPKTVIPQTVMPELKVWKVTTATNLYSRTPSVTYTNSNWRLIKMVKDNPLSYAYDNRKGYNYGSVVMYGNYVYVCNRTCFGISTDNTYYWTCIGTINDSEPVVDAGEIIEVLTINTLLYKIADKGTWMQVRTVGGRVGYVNSTTCTETTQRDQETLPEKIITEQVFRIYATGCDEETNTYTAKARHISYDFMGNCLYDCKITEAKPNEAIAAIQGSLSLYDERRIACNITSGSITQDWSFKNPISALLDPESGLLGNLNARLVRDNNDFYLLDSSNPRTGITIAYGVNMRGVNWTRSIENVKTRVIPRSGSSDKGYKYISDGGRISGTTVQDQGKDYVESSIADEYAVPRILVMDCSYSVGQQYEAPDGTKKTYTEQEVLAKMREDAKEQFTKNKIDSVDVTLDVEFLLIGDTEEYKQYKGLQWVSLYDVVRVKTGKSQIDAETQVTEYEYDSLRERYNSIKLGKINSFTKRIAGYRFINGSITYDKLSPDLIDRIISSNASSTTNSGSAASLPGGGGESFVSVSDNNPTLAWNTQSKIGTVNGTDLHVTMPSNPASASDNNPTLAWNTQSKVGTVNGVDLHVTMPANPAVSGVFYGTCSTAAATQEKAVTISGISSLYDGLQIRIKFNNAQSYNGQPTLNLNNTGAVGICIYGTTAAARYEWRAGEIVDFVYDGTNWIIVDSGHATTSYYGYTKLVDSLTSTSTSQALTANQGKVLNDRIAGMEIKVLTGTTDDYLISTNVNYPTGFTKNNCAVIGAYLVLAHTLTDTLLYTALGDNNIQIYVPDSANRGNDYKIVVARFD